MTETILWNVRSRKRILVSYIDFTKMNIFAMMIYVYYQDFSTELSVCLLNPLLQQIYTNNYLHK